jgi:hypothetical protein
LLDAMPAASGNQNVIARVHRQYFSIVKAERSSSLKHHDPLLVRLIVPKSRGARLARGDDPLDADVFGLGENGGEFFRECGGEIGEEIHRGVRLFAGARPLEELDTINHLRGGCSLHKLHNSADLLADWVALAGNREDACVMPAGREPFAMQLRKIANV